MASGLPLNGQSPDAGYQQHGVLVSFIAAGLGLVNFQILNLTISLTNSWIPYALAPLPIQPTLSQ